MEQKTAFARELRKRQTRAEELLWRHLRNRRFKDLKFRRQHQIDGYIVDFCCPEKKIVIELDGGQHAETRNEDKIRTGHLNREGYHVIRFWNHDVLKNSESVLEAILKFISTPHPGPLPKGERENTGRVVKILFLFFSVLLAGCALFDRSLAAKDVPPEFHQKIILDVDDNYDMYQAPRTGYDVGDLQAFHTQHTFPIVMEGGFKDLFDDVEMMEHGANIEMEKPDVPAIFEVHIIDMSHDIYNEADSYRAQIVIAVAMKSPRGHIFWQQSFRGEGYVSVNPEYSTGLGPQDAVVDAVQDAIGQMKKAILKSKDVRLELRHYKEIEQARTTGEQGL